MNKELEQEARKYNTIILGNGRETIKQVFIAGATSKYVEKQKLLFAIEQLKKLKEDEIYDKIRYVESSMIDYDIMKLEQKLNEL